MLKTFFREEHDIFRKTFRDFVEKELQPHADEWEKDEIFPREVFQRMGELGFLGVHYPEDVGGGGGDYWYTVALRRGAAPLPLGRPQHEPHGAVRHGHAGHQASWARASRRRSSWCPRSSGDKIAALGVTEPNAGSDVAIIQHHRPQGRRRLRHQRLEDLHHQRHARRLHHAGRAHRRRGLRRHQPDALPDRHQGLQGHAQAQEDRQPRLRHRGALLRGLPDPARATCSARRTRASTTS